MDKKTLLVDLSDPSSSSSSSSSPSPPHIVTITKTSDNAINFYTAKYLQSENENLLDYKLKLMELVSEHDVIMIKDLRDYRQTIVDYEEKSRVYEQLWSDSNAAISELMVVIEELKGELRSRGEDDMVRRLEGGVEREE
jgi:translation initiation factor RLI1